LIVETAVWDHQASFPVFLDKHKWIEPGETICEKRLIKLNRKKCISLLLELQIFTKKITWHAMDIVALAELDEKITHGEIAVISSSGTLRETVELEETETSISKSNPRLKGRHESGWKGCPSSEFLGQRAG
jgi:hypothetical protein